jgi:serine/threonine-protein kinase
MKPGDKFDRYTILRCIGRGGMGDVYRAQDSRLQRNVALKILRPDWIVQEGDKSRSEAVERLFREARAAASLEHPNVVVIHDVGEVMLEGAKEPAYFIAMEYIDGIVLRSLVGTRDVPIADRIKWLVDVARALDFAHERGIIHRDVKPDNIILRTDGVIKVLDFGIARRQAAAASLAADPLPTLTEKGVALGTPRYMSPEQMLNEELDGRADQYAWGLSAYELLAGSAPWSGAPDSLQLVAQALTRAPEPLRSRAPEVPEAISKVIDRTLSRERDERYPSMAAVIEAVAEASAVPISAANATLPRLVALQRPDTDQSVDFPTLRGQQSTSRKLVVPPQGGKPRWRLAAIAAVCAGGLAAAVVIGRGKGAAPAKPAPAAALVACAGSAQCSQKLGKPAVCAKDGCVALASEDCRVVTDADRAELASDATVWIGAMYPLTGPDAESFGTREFRAVELAHRDFAMLAGASGPHGSHPIGLLACDDAADPQRALHHLVDEVGVPAVIGFRSSNEAIDAANSTLIPKGVLGVAALNTSPMISSLPQSPGQPRMVWRTTYSAAEMALPVAKLIPDVLEPELAPKLGGKPLRVALVHQDDPTGLGFADVLFRSLSFNGKSALENESSYRDFVGKLGAGDDPAEMRQLVGKLTAFAPHVIVFWGSDDALVRIAEPLEKTWRGPGPRPRYLKTAPFKHAVHEFIGTNADLRRRFLSLTTVSTTAANARFVARYNEAYGDTVTRTISPNSSYDAFYVIAYALYAIGDAPVTGTALAAAIPRLTPPGATIDVGPSGIFDAINKLAAGGRVDLNGATGPLDFDPATGDARVDLAVLCVNVDAQGAAADNRESGLVFDATSGALRGAMRCP